MPPKRKSKPEDGATGTIVDGVATDTADNVSKKPKLDDSGDSNHSTSSQSKSNTNGTTASFVAASSSSSSTTAASSNLPLCKYGAGCYRKNPDHFKEFSHPPSASAPASVPAPTPAPAPVHTTVTSTPSSNTNTSAYESVLKSSLVGKMKIDQATKKILRGMRADLGISAHTHTELIKKFGWSEGEYEDGERNMDAECEQERKILVSDDHDAFEIIKISKHDKDKDREKAAIFAHVSEKFFATMSKAQANYSIESVSLIVNKRLSELYQKRKDEIKSLRGKVDEKWGFHGSTPDAILKIAKTNFLMPDELKKLTQASKKNKKNKKEKPPELLDDGYFGKGIYFTHYSDYALWYCSERDSNQVLMSKLCVGRQFECQQRMDGQGLQKGFDSHVSPKGSELVMFDPNQILPRYIITFEEREAKERQQEY